jgi:hypothetical protein
MKNIAKTTKVTQTPNTKMTPVELGRVDLPTGFKYRFVKYDDAENVILVTPQGKTIENQCMLGAVEIIIPEKHNTTNMVKALEEKLSKAFVMLQDAKWFKADSNTSFEKIGDNVLELYGNLTYQSANECIAAIEHFKKQF